MIVVLAHDQLVQEPLLCVDCREPVSWRGRWVHLMPSSHEARAVEFPRGWCSQ